MHITVFGASGKVGTLVTKKLIANGHTITAQVHHSNLVGIDTDKVTIVRGDIHESSVVAKAIKGSDAVVCALGSWGTKSKDIVSAATKEIIPAMETAGIKRFVSVTGGAANLVNEQHSFTNNISHALLSIMAKPILLDAEEHLRLLAESKLEWTAVRSPVMTTWGNSRYKLVNKPLVMWATVSRTAVVDALVNLLETKSFTRQAPYIRRSH